MLYEVRVEGNEGAWFKHHGSAQRYAELCAQSGLRVEYQLVDKHVAED